MNFETLKQFPYFTHKQVEAFLKKKHPEVVLTRWKNKLIIIEKGKYTLHENPLVYATRLCVPSYISFRSALSYYELTNQIPLQVQVLIKKRKKPLNQIRFFTTPHMFGFKKIEIEGFSVFIAEKEKLLLDCLLYINAGVGIDELELLLQENLNTEKIITYLKRINNLNLIKRVGYLLEKQGVSLYSYFQKEIVSSTNYPLLHQQLSQNGSINKKWRLCINEET